MQRAHPAAVPAAPLVDVRTEDPSVGGLVILPRINAISTVRQGLVSLVFSTIDECAALEG